MNKSRYIIASIDYFYDLVKEATITPSQLTAVDDSQIPPEGLIDTKGNIRVRKIETHWVKEQLLPQVKIFVNKRFNIADDAVLTMMSKVFMSQFALETGYGKSCHNYNVGNLAAAENISANPPYWNKKFFVTMAGEVEKGVHVKKVERFKAYDSFEQGVGDYLRLIEHMQENKKGFIDLIGYAKSGDVESFARGLKQAGYYTEDVEKYTSVLKSSFKNINKEPVEPHVKAAPTVKPIVPTANKVPESSSTEPMQLAASTKIQAKS